MLNNTFYLQSIRDPPRALKYAAAVSRGRQPSSVTVEIFERNPDGKTLEKAPECTLNLEVVQGSVLGVGAAVADAQEKAHGCPDGTTAVGGGCAPCPLGHVSTGGKPCTACLYPAYSSTRGGVSCSVCPANTYPNLEVGGWGCLPVFKK